MSNSIEAISRIVNGHLFGAFATTNLDSKLSPESPEDACVATHHRKHFLLDRVLLDRVLLDAMPLQDARADDLTIVDSMKHVETWLSSPASVALAPMAIAQELSKQSTESNKVVIGVEDLHQAFQVALVAIRGARSSEFYWTGIHSTAVIHPTAEVSESASIGPYVSIGAGCKIGERSLIHPGVQILGCCEIAEDCEIFPSAVLYHGTILHPRVLVHASSILGAYGFGYRQSNSQHIRTAQLGWVEIESDVEIGAGTTIDRGTYGPTRIGRGTKLDNQIQIGHNVHVGQHNLLCAQVGIAGSSSTGSYVVLGGQVGVRDHIHLGDRTMAAAQSGIANDVPDDTSVLGTPALPQREATQMWIHSQRLPEIRKQIKTLESQMKNLIQQMEATLRETESSTPENPILSLSSVDTPSKSVSHDSESILKERAAA